jgi:predicted outer membrane repeat protein
MRNNTLGSGGLSFKFELNTKLNDVNVQFLSKYVLVVNDSVFTGNRNNYSSGAIYFNSSLMSWGKFLAVFYNCSFHNNSGYEGGAVSLQFRSAFTNFIFSSCMFDGNFALMGGAILAQTEANPIQQFNATFQQSTGIPMITLTDCAFQHNVAYENGSVLVIDNPSDSSLLNLVINNTVIQQNQVIRMTLYDLTNSNQQQQQANADATIILKNTNTLINNSSLLKNIGSAIYANKLELHFANFIVFDSNSAIIGGGIRLSKAKLHLSIGTQILFQNNHAGYGGAIYALIDEITEDCFVIPNSESGPFPGEVPQLFFTNNSAAYGGNIMYGPETNSCLTSEDTAYLFNFQDPDKLSTTLPVTVGPKTATHICMCSLDNTPNYCDILKNVPKEVFPGATLSFAVAILHNGELVPRAITANLNSLNNVSTSVLIGGLQMTQRSCTHLNYTLLSYRSTEIITLTLTDDSMVHPLNILAHILSCPLGFSIQTTSPTCDCIPQLAQLGVACNIQDQTFGHPGNIWIGTILYNDSSSNNFESDAFDTLIYCSSCPFDYCNLGYIRIVLEDADEQCSSNRSGILCGGCPQGLSASLGPTHCIECESKTGLHTVLFVFLFSTAGIVLIAFLRLCNLTISQGSANPVMFYANVIHVNGTFFFEQRNPLTVFISWFNLDFGFETCFYNGMDASAKAWLQFLFPFYLWVMIAIIYFASKQSSKFVRLMGRNNHSIILTLLHLSFFKLYRATVAVLLYTDLYIDNGEYQYLRVWRYNGNVNYYSRKHTPLLAFAIIVLILFVIPYALFMICAPLIIRKGYKIRCISFWRLKPFFDAYTGLYKDKAMFWNGLTTIIYTILLITSTEVDTILNLVIVALSGVTLVFLNFAFGGVYRKWTLSVMEAIIHTNMIFLSILSVLSLTKGHSVAAVVYTSTAVSFALFIGVATINGIKELSKESKTIKVKISSVLKWCDRMLGRNKGYTSRYNYSRNSDKADLPRLSDYLLLEESMDEYYATIHRDDILTTLQDEEGTEEAIQLLPLADSTTATVIAHQECNQGQNFKCHKAVTFSVVALEDYEESDDKSSNVTDYHEKINVTEISEVCIDIDENLPLLSSSTESPLNIQNYSIQESISPVGKVEREVDPEVPHNHEYSSSYNSQMVSTNHPLDSDIDATGQRPSLVNLPTYKHMDFLQRLTDPIALAIFDEGESDKDETVEPKIHQLNPESKQIWASKKAVAMANHRKSKKILKMPFGRLQSQTSETIPLLPLKKERGNLFYSSNAIGMYTSVNFQSKESELSYNACPSSISQYTTACKSPPIPHCIAQTIGSQFAASVPFLKPIEVISVTSNGAEYSCEEYGVRVKVPEGALPSLTHSTLEVGIASRGPFEFPNGMIPISPILWICMPHESLLLKPVEITLPHCLTDLTENDPVKDDIGFLKANHHNDYIINSSGKRVYQFREAEGDVSFPDRSNCGVLYTTHFCFECLKVNVTPESTKKRGYCLIYGIPRPWPNMSTDINIGITHYLQTCIEVKFNINACTIIINFMIKLLAFTQQTFKKQIKNSDMEFNFYCSKPFHFKDEIQPVRVAIKHDTSKQWIVIIQSGVEGVSNFCPCNCRKIANL